MIISTKKGAPQAELDRIIDNFEHQGLSVTLIRGCLLYTSDAADEL